MGDTGGGQCPPTRAGCTRRYRDVAAAGAAGERSKLPA